MRGGAFLLPFLSLATLSGATLGMAKLITTLYALELGASAAQIGLIGAAEALGMVLLTLPAGLLIDRFGSRRLYLLASLLPVLLHLAILAWANWLWLAALRLLVGTCVPFRSVAMSGLFLQRLPELGMSKAGWFRGALMVGLLLLGPWLGNWLYSHFGALAFVWVALSFAGMGLWGLRFWRQEAAVVSTSRRSGGLAVLLGEPALRHCCLIEWLASATGSLFATFALVLCLEQLHWSQSEAVALLTTQGLVTVLALFGLGRLLAGLAPRTIYLLALPAGCLALWLMGRLDSFAGLLLAAVLLSLAASAVHLANVGRLSRLPLDKGGVSGLFSLAQTLGMLGGSLLGAGLSHWLELRQLFPAWALLLLAGAALIAWSEWRARAGAGETCVAVDRSGL